MYQFRTFIFRHWIKFLVGVLILFGLAYYFLSGESTPTTGTMTTTTAVERGNLVVSVSGSGQVEATNRVDLKPVAAGDSILVSRVFVKNDQPVKMGQLIAALDTKDASRDVENAALSLKSARVKQKQTDKLYPAETPDDARNRQLQDTAVRQAELAVAKAQAKLVDYYLRAPFDGIVTGLSVASGDSISQSAILASVITREMKVSVTLNEVDVAKVSEGMEVSLSFDALPTLALSGTLSAIDTIGMTTQGVVSYDADVLLAQTDTRLRPGMSATAEIGVAKREKVLLIPNSAIITRGGKVFVRLVASDKNSSSEEKTPEREVKLGLTDDVKTEVLSGLSEGEMIVTNPNVTQASATSTGTGQRSLLNSLMPGRSGIGGNRSSNVR